MGRIALCAIVMVCLSLALASHSAQAEGCECRATSGCGYAPPQQCYYPKRHPWVPYAPQGLVVPSAAAYSLQPTAFVTPQYVAGQAFSAQVAMPQFVASQSLLSPLMTSQALTAQSSGFSARQLAEALRVVAEAQRAEAQAESTTCGSDTIRRLDKLQADIDTLTSTSEKILHMIKAHEARLQALEAKP